MSNDGVNAGRRRFLVAATSVVGAAGAVGAAVPFVGSWFPSAKAKAAGAPVKVNVSKIEPGQQMIAECSDIKEASRLWSFDKCPFAMRKADDPDENLLAVSKVVEQSQLLYGNYESNMTAIAAGCQRLPEEVQKKIADMNSKFKRGVYRASLDEAVLIYCTVGL